MVRRRKVQAERLRRALGDLRKLLDVHLRQGLGFAFGVLLFVEINLAVLLALHLVEIPHRPDESDQRQRENHLLVMAFQQTENVAQAFHVNGGEWA